MERAVEAFKKKGGQVWEREVELDTPPSVKREFVLNYISSCNLNLLTITYYLHILYLVFH